MEKFDIAKRYNKKEVLELDPLDLLERVVANMKIKIPNQITPENQEEAAIELSKSTQYEAYLSEMADRADLMKRKLKLEGIELVSITRGFKFDAPDGKNPRTE